MTHNEANKIFEDWKAYMSIVDKMDRIFSQIPESFLPYPPKILEEALNIVAKKFFDNGDKEDADAIQGTMGAFLFKHEKDEAAFESMYRDLELMINNSELKNTKLANLKKTKDTWLEIKRKKLNYE